MTIAGFMRKGALLALLLATQANAQTTVTIADTIRYGVGSALFAGDMVITPPAGWVGTVRMVRVPTTISIMTGTFTVALVPNDTITPTVSAQNYYQVRYRPTTGQEWTERWYVPTSSATLTLADVIVTTVTPLTSIPFLPLAQLSPTGASNGQGIYFDSALGHWRAGAYGSGFPTAVTSVNGQIGDVTVAGAWTDITGKPFTSFDSSIGVTAGVAGTSWSLVPNKPFTSFDASIGVAGGVAGTSWPLLLSKPMQDPSSYNFSVTVGAGVTGDLSVAGAKTVTFTTCPLGTNYTDSHHYVRISGGTGTAEAVLITGGSCVAGAAGTLIFTTANTHTGSWVISSATAGIHEALQALKTAAAGGTVLVPPGSYTLYGPMGRSQETVSATPSRESERSSQH
jgi:hypothetical protein